MSKSESNLNKQSISLLPDALIELFEIDFSNMQLNFEQLKELYGINVGADTIYRFCSAVNGVNPIIWKGKQYQPMPITAEGFEQKNDGRFPRPSFILSNVDGIFSRIIYNNKDFVGCKVTRKRTYVRFLDDENFVNRNLNSEGKNPFGAADKDSYIPDDIYYINRKLSEDRNIIVFELSSPLELTQSYLPARRLFSSLCTWNYRCEIGCGYKGLPIETNQGQDLTSGFVENKNYSNHGYVSPDLYPNGLDDIPNWSKNNSYVTSDVVKVIPKDSDNPYKKIPQVFVCIQSHGNPTKHHPYFDREYWLKDDCSKDLRACKKRFDPNSSFFEYNKANDATKLNFGGFPGTYSFPYER